MQNRVLIQSIMILSDIRFNMPNIYDDIIVHVSKFGNCSCPESKGYWDGETCPRCGKAFTKVNFISEPALDFPEPLKTAPIFPPENMKIIRMEPKK